MPAVCYDLNIEQGATYRQVFRWRDEDGTYRDFTGCTARMHIRVGIDATDIFLELTTENDRITLDDEGNITLIIAAEDTQDLLSTDGLVYDLEIIDGAGEVTRALRGKVYIIQEVTR